MVMSQQEAVSSVLKGTIVANCKIRSSLFDNRATASKILLGDPTRYLSSLEFKPFSRAEVQPRFVGSSHAILFGNNISRDCLGQLTQRG